jgi:hypothetical protein
MDNWFLLSGLFSGNFEAFNRRMKRVGRRQDLSVPSCEMGAPIVLYESANSGDENYSKASKKACLAASRASTLAGK